MMQTAARSGRLPLPLRLLLLPLLATALSGCAGAGYYWQTVRGQFDVWDHERPITQVLDDADTPAVLKEKLALITRARAFASAELGLPDNASYRRYADLGRPYVVWNVFATPEFSTQPLQWCFVMAGCVGYRGYFSHGDAQAFAHAVAAQGNDVYIGGVPAYSTLGWFADPILNTFVNYPPVEVARIIFHELAHQVVYVKGDTEFNESFAVTVEREGLTRWVASHGSADDRTTVERMRRYREDFVALIQRYRGKLDDLYRSGVAPEAMRGAKASVFTDMRKDYATLKAQWGGYAGYDRWFAQPPSNALLAPVNLYSGKVPAFEALLARCDHDLPRFYAAVKGLAREDKTTRDAHLAEIARAAMGAIQPGARATQ